MFGNGSCYVYDSLPFSYAYFLKDWSGIQILQQVVEAGGDTDTNAKMVGEMLGALHGLSLFQQPENEWTITGLKCFDELMKLADVFCDTFGIE